MSWDILPKGNLQYLLTKLKGKLDLKVDAVIGKGLSTNDYTTSEKSKLAGIEDGAQVNTVNSDDISGSITVTGNPITITDGSETYAEELSVDLEPIQSGSGTPSPSNIRPIQGYDIVSVDRCGKNLWDFKSYLDYVKTVNSNLTWSESNCQYTVNNIANLSQAVYTFSKTDIPVRFSIKAKGNGGQGIYLLAYNVNGTEVARGNTGTNTSEFKELTLSATCSKVLISYANQGGMIITEPQIELGSQTTVFEPFDAQTVSLQLGNKNLLPMTVEEIKAANTSGTWSGNTYTYRGVTVEILTDNYNNIIGYDVDGTASGGNLEFRLIPNSPNTYLNKKINGSPASSGYEVSFLISMFDGTTWKSEQFSYNQADSVLSINQPNIVISLFVKSGSTASHSKFYPMIRDATVIDPTFSPYNPTLGGMVYGGQLTLKDDGSAVFVGDRACVDLGDLTWNYNSNPQMFDATIPNGKHINSVYGLPCSCSKYEAFTGNVSNLGNKQISVGSGFSTSVCKAVIKDSSYTDATTFKTAMSGVQLVYPLATPFTLHLSAEQLKLLQGTNNVWSNAGDVTLKYQPDNAIGDAVSKAEKYTDRKAESLFKKVGNFDGAESIFVQLTGINLAPGDANNYYGDVNKSDISNYQNLEGKLIVFQGARLYEIQNSSGTTINAKDAIKDGIIVSNCYIHNYSRSVVSYNFNVRNGSNYTIKDLKVFIHLSAILSYDVF